MPSVTGIHDRRRALTKGQRTRERLLRAAIDRFGSQGYRSTSVSQLSRDAGLTPAAAYAYFDDKESFWKAAIQADLDLLRSEVLAGIAHSERPIADMMLSLIDGVQRHPLAHRVMVEGSAADLQLVLAHRLFASTTRQIEQGLMARQADGRLSSSVPADQLALGMETIAFSMVLSLVRAGVESERHRIEAVVALLHAAAGGPPTPDERRR